MKRSTKKEKDIHSGSSFDSFLEAEGIREEVEAVAIKRVLAWQCRRAGTEAEASSAATAKTSPLANSRAVAE